MIKVKKILSKGSELLALALVIVCFTSHTNLDALDTEDIYWRWSNPENHGHDIQDYIISDGIGFQVAEAGYVYWSQDFITWNPVYTGYDISLRCVTTYNDTYYIGAESGVLLSTVDFVEFTRIDLNTEDWIEGISASDSLIVAVGDSGSIFTSPDGTQWTERSSGTSEWLRDVAYGGNRFVAVGENGTIRTSSDGISWSASQSRTSNHLNAVASNGSNRFVAVGDNGTLVHSLNGTTWTSVSTGQTNEFLTVHYANNRIVAAGEKVAISLNSFFQVYNELNPNNSEPLPEYLWMASAFDGENWHFAGSAGLNFIGSQSDQFSPLSWSTGDDSLRNWIWDMQVLDDVTYAVGDFGTILATSDGINWDSRVVPNVVTNKLFLSISGNQEGLVATGTDGLILYSPGETIEVNETNIVNGVPVITTTQSTFPGINWELIEVNGLEADLKGNAFHNDHYFLAGEGGTLVRSSNGKDWEILNTPSENFLSGLASNGDRLISVGNNGTVIYSDDSGDSWNTISPFTDAWLLQVRYLNGKFVAVGQAGTIAMSEDGLNWDLSATPSQTALINDVSYFDGFYYAVGTLGRVWQSQQGSQWSSLPTNTSKSLYTLAPLDERLVVAGIEGVILRTPLTDFMNPINIETFQTLESEDEKYFGFVLSGKTDQYFSFDFSTSLNGPWENFLPPTEILEDDGIVSLLYPVDEFPENIFFRVVPEIEQ